MQTLLSYWRQVLCVTRERFKEYWIQIFFMYLTLPIGDMFIYYNYGRARASEWTWSSAMTQVFPLTALGILSTIVFMFVFAPYLLHKKTESKRQDLADQLKRFEERASPKVRFLLEDRPPYKNLEASTPDGKIWRFRVHVRNTWHEQLTDCAVVLEGISPIVGTKFIPRRLKLASDNPPDVLNEPHRQSFSLAPIDGKELIDVCEVDMRPGANRTRIFIATEGHRDLNKELHIPNGNYIFTLKAEAHIGKSWGESFVLETNHTEPKFFRLSTQPTLGTQDSSIPAT